MENIINEKLVKNEKFLEDILLKNDIKLTQDIKNKFYIYYNYLIEYNEKVNLTALTDLDDVYIKHFADSILGAGFIDKNANVCDIGTGAGFPGVVLKIVRPDINLTLVDGLNKRVEFLINLLNKLAINDVSVLHYRAEDVDFKNGYLNKFDYVVARAVAKLNTLCEYCLPFVKTGGRFIAYKSKDVEAESHEAEKAINILGGKLADIKTIKLDACTDRTFVIVDKI